MISSSRWLSSVARDYFLRKESLSMTGVPKTLRVLDVLSIGTVSATEKETKGEPIPAKAKSN